MNFDQLPRWLLWSLFLPLVALNIWITLKTFEYFHSFFSIVIIATLLAFLLSYPVRKLQSLKISKQIAIGLVLLFVVVGIGLVGVTLLPLIFDQALQLSERLPDWWVSSSSEIEGIQMWVEQRQFPINLADVITELENRLSGQIQALSGLALSTVPIAISNIVDIFLTLVLTVYLLLHGEQVWHSLFRWLPVHLSQRAKPAISKSFGNYFASQATLASMMGTAMTIAFLLIQVPFGFLFGLAVGILALVPFGAAAGIIIVSSLTAIKSIWLGVRVLILATIIDQIIENAIAPQLIGSFIGLNPVWILTSLLLGAKIGGVLGLIIAVPIAGSIKTIFLNVPPNAASQADLTLSKSS